MIKLFIKTKTQNCIALHYVFIQVGDWKILLIEAGQDPDIIMDIPVIAGQLQNMPINWKYRTIPMNNSCLSNYYIIIFTTIVFCFIINYNGINNLMNFIHSVLRRFRRPPV